MAERRARILMGFAPGVGERRDRNDTE